MKIQIIEVRTGIFGIPRKINAVQGDSGRILRCKVTDMSIPSGSTARICARKPSGAKVYNSCNISGNTVEVELTTQMLAEIGKTQAQIEVTYSGKRITTFKFVIDVEECLVDNSSIESTNEFTALEKALADTAADSNIAQKTVVFSQASTRSLPVSGENIATIIGKIKKYLTDLGTAAFQNIANNLTTTAAGSVLDARQGKALQDQISSLNTKISTTLKQTSYEATSTMSTHAMTEGRAYIVHLKAVGSANAKYTAWLGIAYCNKADGTESGVQTWIENQKGGSYVQTNGKNIEMYCSWGYVATVIQINK